MYKIFVSDNDFALTTSSPFARNRESAEAEKGACGDPLWSPDGNRVVYTDPESLYVVPADAGSPPESLNTGEWAGFSQLQRKTRGRADRGSFLVGILLPLLHAALSRCTNIAIGSSAAGSAPSGSLMF